MALSTTAFAQNSVSPAAEAAESDDISAPEGQFIHDVRADLVAEHFDKLDRLADSLRRGKDRWVGGGWKLRTLYEALDFPHATDADMTAHLEHMHRWMAQRPESITARIVLATSLVRWAWVARGNTLADKVPESAWPLFNQRVQEAQVVLESARDMHTMDPQWFLEEMVIGKAQGWDKARMREVFERGLQFEPDYQYLYKSRTEYLLPKWYGGPNEATTFARQTADHLGGDEGDYIYWEIATVILRKGNGKLAPFAEAMDWPRIQRGYDVVATRYQANKGEKNELAFMAYLYKDKSVAQQQFAAIGNGWSRGVWRDQNFFEKVRDWAGGHENWP